MALYIGNLSEEVTETMLFERFSTCGAIKCISLYRKPSTDKNLSFAFVTFYQAPDAERAFDIFNYSIICGCPMRVMRYQYSSSVRKSGAGNIFIKNLDKAIDEQMLFDTFSAFGNVLSCKIPRDEKGPKGYGFVHFESEQAAHNAIRRVHGMMMMGKIVSVTHFIPAEERRRTQKNNDQQQPMFTNVFVKNFRNAFNDETLRQLFERFGNITSAKVMTDENGRSKGFGFVNFVEPAAAQQAIDEMNNTEVEGRRIYVGRFKTRTERQHL